ncbi:phage tail protein [Tritonibacter mobilis]|uniref:phage tail protein n=1 Tax=Tritonibacter mobilis TaxID=379347 RepID=UPI003A5C38BA
MMRICLFAFLFIIASGEHASAAPVAAAVSAIATWIGGLGAVATALLQIAVGTALNLIAKAKMRKGARSSGGIQTDVTLTGGTNSESFILGYYGTAGTWVCPPLSRGAQLKILTFVIDIAGLPGHSLEEVFVNGEKLVLREPIRHGVTVSSTEDSFSGLVSLTYFDGSQTEAPQMMLDNYGNHPDFPWSPAMVGRGRCYVIVEFEANEKVFSGLPQMRFGVRGIPMLDPRDGQETQSDNLGLLAYTILRGIELPDGSRWGGEASLEDLPMSVWASAMNEADRLIETANGDSEPQFRAGYEVKVADTEPADVLERLMDACTGDLAEEGGLWYVHLGAPPLPSAFLTDADLIVSAPMSLTPFASLADSVNSLTLKFPNPAAAWEVSESERVLRPDLEEKDEGRRLQEDLSLDACPFPLQVQRVGSAYIEDAKRDVRHSVALPPDFAHLPPLSVVSWSSEHNQYSAKLFSIEEKSIHPHDLISAVSLREIDPADHEWSSEDELPVPVGIPAISEPVPFILDDVRVSGVEIRDSDGRPRRVAIQVSEIPVVEGVEWRVLDSAGLRVADGIAMDVGDTFLITQGILPAQNYFVGLRVAGGGIVDWSDWYSVTTSQIADGYQELKDLFDQKDAESRETLESFNRNFAFAFDRYAEFDVLGRAGAFLDNARTEGKVEQVKTDLSVDIDTVSAQITQTMTALTDLDVAFSAYKLEVQSDFDDVTAFVDQNIYTIAEADAAIAAQTSSLTTQVNGLNTTVQSVNQSVNGILGQAGWHINNNGVMSGFGLMSELVNGQVTSEILLNADNIRFVNSSGVGAASSPFQVVGSETFIKSAFILDASVGTLKIAGNAITVPVFAQGGLLTGNGSFQNGVTALINLPETGDVIILWSVEQGYAQSGPSWGFRILANGVEIASRTGMTAVNDYPAGYAVLPNVSGSQTIQFQWLGSNGQVTGRPSLQLVGRMR